MNYASYVFVHAQKNVQHMNNQSSHLAFITITITITIIIITIVTITITITIITIITITIKIIIITITIFSFSLVLKQLVFFFLKTSWCIHFAML